MNLKFLGTTSNSGSCPNLYRTDRDTYVVQGYKVTDPDALAAARDRNMLDTETLVEIPVALLGFAPTTINSDSYRVARTTTLAVVRTARVTRSAPAPRRRADFPTWRP